MGSKTSVRIRRAKNNSLRQIDSEVMRARRYHNGNFSEPLSPGAVPEGKQLEAKFGKNRTRLPGRGVIYNVSSTYLGRFLKRGRPYLFVLNYSELLRAVRRT